MSPRILQMRYGVNAWLGFAVGIAAGALVGAVIGALSFRSGLRGSYFALVTLAFAEVLRIVASVAPITGAGVGTLIKLDLRPEAFQFQSRAPFYWIVLGLVGAVADPRARDRGQPLRRLSRRRARERGRRASALGVDADHGQARRHDALGRDHGGGAAASTRSISCSSTPASPTARGSRSRRCSRRSSAASARCSARCSARWWSRRSANSTKLVTGDAPGLDLVIYGCVLIVVVAFAPRGIAGVFADLRRDSGRASGADG